MTPTADLKVEDCMSPGVVSLSAGTTLDRAAQAMVERKVGSAVVMEGNEILGIITERDVMRAVARGLVPWNTMVSNCMTADPQTVGPSTSAEGALSTMLSNGFRHLPVVNQDGLIGIVSLRDLVGVAEEPPPWAGPRRGMTAKR